MACQCVGCLFIMSCMYLRMIFFSYPENTQPFLIPTLCFMFQDRTVANKPSRVNIYSKWSLTSENAKKNQRNTISYASPQCCVSLLILNLWCPSPTGAKSSKYPDFLSFHLNWDGFSPVTSFLCQILSFQVHQFCFGPVKLIKKSGKVFVAKDLECSMKTCHIMSLFQSQSMSL